MNHHQMRQTAEQMGYYGHLNRAMFTSNDSHQKLSHSKLLYLFFYSLLRCYEMIWRLFSGVANADSVDPYTSKFWADFVRSKF